MTNDRQIKPVDVQLRNHVVDRRDRGICGRDIRSLVRSLALARKRHTLGNNDARALAAHKRASVRARARTLVGYKLRNFVSYKSIRAVTIRTGTGEPREVKIDGSEADRKIFPRFSGYRAEVISNEGAQDRASGPYPARCTGTPSLSLNRTMRFQDRVCVTPGARGPILAGNPRVLMVST